MPDELELKLSDSFDNKEVQPDVDVTVHVLNINFGHNKELMVKCHRLWEYAYLIDRMKRNMGSGMSLNEAVDEAIRHCIEKDILAKYLIRNRMEVHGMLLEEYDERAVKKLWRKEAFEDGYADGMEKGMEQGMEQGMERGIKALVETCRELEIPKQKTVEKLVDKFGIEEYKAKEYTEKHW